MIDEPGIDVGEHRRGETVGAGVGLESDPDAAGAERGDIAAGGPDRHTGVPLAMDDQDPQVAACLEPAQRGEASRDPSVDGDHASKPLGITQARAGRRLRLPRQFRPGRSARNGRGASGGSGGSPRRHRPRARRSGRTRTRIRRRRTSSPAETCVMGRGAWPVGTSEGLTPTDTLPSCPRLKCGSRPRRLRPT